MSLISFAGKNAWDIKGSIVSSLYLV